MRSYLVEEQPNPNTLATDIEDDNLDIDSEEGEFGQDPADILARREEIAGINIRGLVTITDH